MEIKLTLISSQSGSPHSPLLPTLLSNFRSRLLVSLVTVGIAGHFSQVNADEPMLKFSEALRDRGYFDVAIDYFKHVDRATLSPESLERLPLEQATTYRQAAAASQDLRQADTLLAKAQKAINSYAPLEDDDRIAFQTATFRGDLLYSRARVSMAQGQSKRISKALQEQIKQQTQVQLESSRKQYLAATKHLASVLRAFQIDPEDGSTKTELTKLRAQYTHLKARNPALSELLADTWEAGSPQRKQLLETAAADAKSVWNKYQKYAPAMEACLTAARCYQKNGQPEQSQAMIEEIFALATANVSSTVQQEALFIATKNWQTETPYPWETVLQELQPVVQRLTPEQSTNPQWLIVKLELARALQEKSNALSGQDSVAARRAANDSSKAALKLAQSIARTQGDAHENAIALLKKWGKAADVPSKTATTFATGAKTFAEAESRGKAIVHDVESLLRKVAEASKKVRTAESSAEKQQAQANVDQLKQKSFSRCDSALKFFDQAIRLANKSIPQAKINNIRYLQCYCYFARQQFIESSVIAEFLLDKFPNFSGTRQATSILLRNYTSLLDNAKGDKSFERSQLVRACESVLAHYPNTTEASGAAAKLARLYLLDGNYDVAQSYFDRIPKNDPQRSALALSLGRRTWFDWSKSTDRDPKQLSFAKQYLSEGVTNANPRSLSYAAAEGALLLAEAHLAFDEVEAAIQRLETAEVAPLKLIEQSHPAITNSGRLNLYHQESAMTAIKAYMAAMQTSSDGQKWIGKASSVIANLQQRLKSSGNIEDAKRLTSVYRLISQRLIRQFDSLAAGQPRAEFANSLATFLTTIEQESNDARTVVWAGSTLLSVANTLNQDGSSEQAKPIFDQAVSALDRAETLGFGSSKDAATLTRELKRQRALAQRGAGKYDAAITQFTQLLTVTAGDLGTQLDAAMTLHQKAAALRDAQGFAKAILGTNPVVSPKTKRKQNVIWGWRKIVQATRGKEQYVDAFYRSLYHMIEARFEMGRINHSSDGIQKALKELNNWQQRNSNFDNGPWKTKFAQLKQRIQKQ